MASVEMPGAGPRLLATVTDEREAAAALAAGADLLDVKDPRRGSLGACDPGVLRAIVAIRDRVAADGAPRTADGLPRTPGWSVHVPVSAALGDRPDGATGGLAAACAVAGADFVKVGLAGIGDPAAAADALRAVVERARRTAPKVRVVAAVFVDDPAGIGAAALPAAAVAAGAAGCLLDTLVKDGRILFDHLDTGALAHFIMACRGQGLLAALAGSLGPEHAGVLREVTPDLVGSRGALCDGGRNGRLDPARVSTFRAALRGVARPA